MTTDSHREGSRVSHGGMSDEEFDRELAEMKVQLNVLMELLQKSEEDQRCGWILRKKVKWHRLQVKLEHRFCSIEE